MTHERVARIAAVSGTMNAYLGRRFAWGEHDCLHLATDCLERLGYKANFDKAGPYETEIGAAKALLRAGYRSTEEAIDDLVGKQNRIDPLAALPGDVVGFADATNKLTAMTVAMGNGEVLGFQSDHICRIFSPNYSVEGATYVAWRCDPCRQLQPPSAR